MIKQIKKYCNKYKLYIKFIFLLIINIIIKSSLIQKLKKYNY